MNSLLKLFDECSSQDWCTQIPCTTCGTLEFRNGLAEIESVNVIKGLGSLNQIEFNKYRDVVISVFKWLYGKGIVNTPKDIEIIRDSEAYLYFSSFYESYQERKKQQEKNRKQQLIQFKEAQIRRATKARLNLPNAIRRGDLKAIKSLVEKSADPS
jgi:hypothetical protein